jgi:predicted house-cleaning noncanonical NTP pyrophosphatase (MazG superfamily)
MRVEISSLLVGLCEFEKFALKFIENSKIFVIELIALKEITLKIFNSFLNFINFITPNILGFYNVLVLEVFLLEFILKGGNNFTYISNEHEELFDSLTFEKLHLHTNEIFNLKSFENIPKTKAINSLIALISSSKKINLRIKRHICKVFELGLYNENFALRTFYTNLKNEILEVF